MFKFLESVCVHNTPSFLFSSPPSPLLPSLDSLFHLRSSSLLVLFVFYFALPSTLKSPDDSSFKTILTFYLFYFRITIITIYWLSIVCRQLSKAPYTNSSIYLPTTAWGSFGHSDETETERNPVTYTAPHAWVRTLTRSPVPDLSWQCHPTSGIYYLSLETSMHSPNL